MVMPVPSSASHVSNIGADRTDAEAARDSSHVPKSSIIRDVRKRFQEMRASALTGVAGASSAQRHCCRHSHVYLRNTCIYNSCRYNTSNERYSQAPRVYESQVASAEPGGDAPLRRIHRRHRAEELAILVALARGPVWPDSSNRFGRAHARGRLDSDAQLAAAGRPRLAASAARRE